MNKTAGAVAILLLAFILQIAIASQLQIFGVTPNIVFVLIATIALHRGPRQGAIVGFVSGFIFDLVGSGPIGVSSLAFCAAGAIAGSLRHNATTEGWRLSVILVMLASFFAELLYAITLLLIGGGISFVPTLTGVILPTALYNGIIAAAVLPVLAHFLRQERSVQTFRRIGR